MVDDTLSITIYIHIPSPLRCNIHHCLREMLRNKRHTEAYPGTCIGDGAVISTTAHVSHSVIGRHCQIKDGAVLRNAYLMDGVAVEEGARVSYSILCSGVVVKAGGQVSRGCMLGQGYVVFCSKTKAARLRDSMLEANESSAKKHLCTVQGVCR